MAAPAKSDQAIQDRILNHMNTSHSRELTHYLRCYSGLTARQARGASLVNVGLQGMRIRASSGEYVVHFVPSVESWGQIRPRLVEMDAIARDRLGLSDIYVTSYHGPRPVDAVVMAAVTFYFVCFFSLPWIVPSSPIWSLLSAYFPGGPEFFRWLVNAIFIPVLGIHLIEATLLDRTRLQKHGVDRWSGQWWMWMASCFLEGFAAFRRFDGVVSKKKAQKAAAKH